MKSLLEQVNEVDNLSRQVKKMISKMNAGQWIQAFRDANRMDAALEKNKQDLISDSENK